MPKSSKVTRQKQNTTTRLKEPTPVDTRDSFYCCRCTRKFKSQKGHFSVVHSPLWRGNNDYIPLCYPCMEEVYEHYREVLGGPREAIRRICSKFDIYWNDEIYKLTVGTPSTQSRIRTYIARANMIQFAGKTFDDTLDEESGIQPELPAGTLVKDEIMEEEYVPVLSIEDIDPDIIQFWGSGYTPDVYMDLDRRFQRWTSGNVAYAHDDPAQESILKQICILERRIESAGMNGTKISEDINAYNSLLGSANLKPSQKKADAQAADGTPFGVWIQRWENEKPIPEPDPEFADVDGIVRYISIWFLGHLCKMLKIKNSYSRMYEDEIERLRVEKPEYDGEDDEEFFQDVFESGGG